MPGTALARALRATLLALALLTALAGAALAHASLNATQPEDGSILDAAPSVYSLTFSEPVSPLTLRLVRPDSSSIMLDDFVLRDRTLEIVAPANPGRGTHVLSWRVVSADRHPVGGSVVFSIGEASAETPLVEEPVDQAVRAGVWLSRVALYVGLFFGVGGVFARRVLMPDITSGSGIAGAALAIGAVGTILSAGFQGLDALGAQSGRLADPVIWSTGLGTTYGFTIWAALLAFLSGAAGLLLHGRTGIAAAVVAVLAAAVAPAFSGHASAASPQWLMRPAVFLHVAAIIVWIGALAPLGLALKRREPGATLALRRFSRIIPPFVAVLVATGLVLAIVQVEDPSALLTTAYGQVFLVKIILLAGLFLLAAVNRWSLTLPAQGGDAAMTRRLARSVAVEVVVALAIIGAAAAWRFTPPPRVLAAQAREPATAYFHTDRALAYLWMRPGRAGTVDVSVNVLTGDFMQLDAKEVTIVLSNPNAGIEPFSRKLTRSGEANWRADGLTIPLPGLWRVRIDVLVSDFELVRLEGQIRIRP
jgi:copper transport protein